jgi:hypothetical protein
MATVATAEVDIRAKLDQFEQEMKSAHSRLQEFDRASESTSAKVRKLDTDTNLAGKAMAGLSATLAKAELGMKALEDANAAAVAAVKGFVAANDNAKQSAQQLDATHKSSAHTLIERAESFFKVVTAVKLASSVAYLAIPAFKNVADSMLGIGKSTAALLPSFGKFGEAIKDATAKATPFVKVAEAAHFAQMAATMPIAAAGAAAVSKSFRDVASETILGGLKALTTAFGLIAPAALNVGRAVMSALTPLLTFITRITLPIAAVVLAFKGLFALFKLGQENVEKLNGELDKMRGGILSYEAFNRYSKAADDLKIKTDLVTASFKKFYEVTQERLGGSPFQKTLDELTKAGNFANNAGLQALKTATTTEERYRAVAELITQASAKGERLAGLKLAEQFLPPELMEKLRVMPDFLDLWEQKAAKVKGLSLIDEQNIVRASELKTELDDAYEILHQKWELDLMPNLTRLSLEFYAVWVRMVSQFAKTVDWVGQIVNKMIDVVTPTEEWAAAVSKAADKYSQIALRWLPTIIAAPLAASLKAISALTAPPPAPVVDPMEAARRKLIIGMSDASNVARGMRDSLAVVNAVIKDQSKTLDDNAKLWDKEVERIRRHIAIQQADAMAVGQGVAAQARLRVEQQLLEFATGKGMKVTAQMAAEIKNLGDKAAAAALQLAKMKLQEEVRFEARTMFLSDEDVQIANKLKEIYPELAHSAQGMAKALQSGEAQSLRLLMNLKQMKDTVVNFNETFVTGFIQNMEQGMKMTQALGQASAQAVNQVINEVVKLGVKWATVQAMGALFGGGASGVGGAVGLTAAVAPLTAALTANTAAVAANTIALGGETAATAAETTAATAETAATTAETAATATQTGVSGLAGLGGIGALPGLSALQDLFSTLAPIALAPIGLRHGGLAGVRRYQSGGLASDEVPIIAHRGEEILPLSDPRHRFNQGQGARGGMAERPIINVSFTAQGRLMSEEIRQHAQTIAEHVANQWTYNRKLRPSY